MRNVERPHAIRVVIHTFYVADSVDIVHTTTAQESFPLVDTGGTVTIDGEMYLIGLVSDHLDIVSGKKYYLYEVQQIDKMDAEHLQKLF